MCVCIYIYVCLSCILCGLCELMYLWCVQVLELFSELLLISLSVDHQDYDRSRVFGVFS